MYKLLVVDNERIVVDSLLHYFEKNAADQLEAAGAYSAREAMRIMEGEKVDILLTDIRMPGMDGLQLQKEVSRHWPWCRTLSLTGFNEFEYVQEALRGGGDDYLLKTEGNEAVLRTVLRVVEALDHQIEVDELNQKVRKQYEEALPLLNYTLLLGLVEGRTPAPEDLADRFRQQKIRLSPEKVWPILVRFDVMGELENRDFDLLRLSIAAIARKYLGMETGLEQIQISADSLVWLADFGEGWSVHRRQVYLQGVVEAVQQQCAAKLGVHLSACMARESVCWAELPERTESLKRRLNRSVRWDRDGQILFHRLMFDAGASQDGEYVSGDVRRRLDGIVQLDAYLEGGNRWQQTWHVTLPGMRAVIVMLATLSLGNILNAGFEQVLVLYNSLVMDTGDIIDTFVYRLGLEQGKYAVSTAVGLFKFVVSLFLISTAYFLTNRFANYRIL